MHANINAKHRHIDFMGHSNDENVQVKTVGRRVAQSSMVFLTLSVGQWLTASLTCIEMYR